MVWRSFESAATAYPVDGEDAVQRDVLHRRVVAVDALKVPSARLVAAPQYLKPSIATRIGRSYEAPDTLARIERSSADIDAIPVTSGWATALRRACSRRERLAHPNTGDASSLWPTPTTSLYANSVSLELSAEGLKLRDDPTRKGSQISIGKAARTFTLIWLLVRATGAVPTGRFRFPCSRPLHLNLATGPRYSPGDLSFNPNFSDWVMVWPIGWTEPGRPVTGFARWLRRSNALHSHLERRFGAQSRCHLKLRGYAI